MSTIHKLFRIGMPALLSAALLGCGWGTAAAVSSDIVRNDRAYSSGSALSLSPVSAPGAEKPTRESLQASKTAEAAKAKKKVKTVGGATPSFQSAILEKQAENSDTVGWLRVPGTGIDTPIVQNPAANNPYPLKNNYYLNRTFDGTPHKDGTFCADYRASFSGGRKGLSRITALYGHSWDDDPNGGLFSQLKRFRDPEFAQEHPYIFFSTASGDMAWEVFAVFDTTIYLPYIRPNLPFEKYDQSLQMVYDLSYYNYDVAVWEQDKILVLSTCTYSVAGRPVLPEINDYRFVVMARLADPKSRWKEKAVFAVNDSPALPDETRKMIHL